jgi:CubicO group peptidase (beta-lactamase class C family)
MRNGLIIAACATLAALAPSVAHADYQDAVVYSAKTGGVSLLVMRHGKTVLEHYADGVTPDAYFELASSTKSFWGVAAAAAVQDGLMTLDEPVSKTITE